MIKFLVEEIKVEFMAFEISERAEYRQFEMVRGDTAPCVQVKFMKTMDFPFDITNYEVHFVIRKADDMNTIINDGHTLCVQTASTLGEAKYCWVAGDTDSEGVHFGEFVLISQNGSKQTIKDRIRFLFI